LSDWEPDFEGEDDFESPIAPSQYHSADTELLLQQLRDLVDNAPNVPLSSTPRISREEVLDLLDEALVRFPDELKAARWLLKEKDEFLVKMQHEADALIDQARARAERMVQRTEVVKAAETRAYQILDTAEAEARRLRHEVEDFCDQKLASFEIVLERTLKMVSSGRAKLQGTNLTADIPVGDPAGDEGEAYEQLNGDAAHPDLPPPPTADVLFHPS
jgi:hypothetical protein